ncbi:hypothetical protein CHLRE_02g103784v5 [Chlamydomonas reinhardtii]|uniref:Uncharacterized protein n=1 Tax=Chlamydomonas reinhardtii TaxID=3055 RepID=A0A2K3E2I0_CHLRE|nr:uncharacterized protein CHLRE_02g103784v5 [Chlamydomonas reinhardtii]PNW86977.1 hypothetical protein CHLRE_02g103784v5 [Chlamydomonas reinhardtii]
MGQAVANAVKLSTGMDIPYQEGLMLIVSTIVMAVSIGIWIVIDAGNRADRKAHLAVLESRAAHRTAAAAAAAAAAAGGSAGFGATAPAPRRTSTDLERLNELARALAVAEGRDPGPSVEAGAGSGVPFAGAGSAHAEKRYSKDPAHSSSLRRRGA